MKGIQSIRTMLENAKEDSNWIEALLKQVQTVASQYFGLPTIALDKKKEKSLLGEMKTRWQADLSLASSPAPFQCRSFITLAFSVSLQGGYILTR